MAQVCSTLDLFSAQGDSVYLRKRRELCPPLMRNITTACGGLIEQYIKGNETALVECLRDEASVEERIEIRKLLDTYGR